MGDRVSKAFERFPRENFLPPNIAGEAEWDMPLLIGYGQTNSQPTTVRMMLKWLDVHPGQTVLDVGSGSGWSTALLTHLTGSKGRVIAVERIPELVTFGQSNCKKLGLKNVEFHKAKKTFGWPDQAPYDRILVSAAAQEIPGELIEQIALEGRLVIPVKNSVIIVTKDKQGNIDQLENYGFTFVPLLRG